jgi:hypothetical protein
MRHWVIVAATTLHRRQIARPLRCHVVAVVALVLVEVDEVQAVIGEDTPITVHRERVLVELDAVHDANVIAAVVDNVACREQERATRFQNPGHACDDPDLLGLRQVEHYTPGDGSVEGRIRERKRLRDSANGKRGRKVQPEVRKHLGRAVDRDNPNVRRDEGLRNRHAVSAPDIKHTRVGRKRFDEGESSGTPVWSTRSDAYQSAIRSYSRTTTLMF